MILTHIHTIFECSELTNIKSKVTCTCMYVSSLTCIITLCSFLLSLSLLRESVIVAVNQEYTDKEQVIHLKAGDEVAIIPPISGG